MNRPLHYNIPSWVITHLRSQTCNKCHSAFKKENIVAIGMRETEKGPSPYVEHQCAKCRYRQIFSFSHKASNLEQLCYMLLKGINERKKLRAIKQRVVHPKNPMTNDEVDKFLKQLNIAETFEDVLKQIGAIEIHKTLTEEAKKKKPQ